MISNENGVVYFPSVDAGALGSYLRKPDKFREFFGMSPRWWDEEWPTEYSCPFLLISAGFRYKKMDYVAELNIPKNFNIFGDSGGYQIVSGALEWSDNLRIDIFNWLENNSTIAANLDIPPRGKMAGKYDECLALSKKNFEYFYKNQSGKVEYLNCIQGFDYDSYKFWYDSVKDYEFSGWAAGEPQGPARYLAIICILLPEILSGKSKYIHFFGVSSIQEMIVLSYIQKIFNDYNFQCTITMDSSSPGLSSTYGFYCSHANLEKEAFKYIHIERDRDSTFYKNPPAYPINQVDSKLFNIRTISDISKSFLGVDYAAIALHNLSVFIDIFKTLDRQMKCDDYAIQQLVSPMTWKIIEAAKLIITSQNPDNEFKKYLPFFHTIKNNDISKYIPKSESDFFNF